MPARASMLTGRYVHQHGVIGNATNTPADGGTFLWQLRQAGYHTAAVGKCHLLRPEMEARDPAGYAEGMRQLGWADADQSCGGKHESARVPNRYQAYLAEAGLLDAYRDYFARGRQRHHGIVEPTPLPTEAFIDWWVAERAIATLDSYDGDAPLFLHVGFPGPHHPFDAPTEFVTPYAGVEAVGHQPPPAHPTPYQQTLLDIFTPISDEMARGFTAAYYGNVALIDHKVGEITAAIARRGRPAIVVYAADHGESLGEHGLLEKLVFYEGAVRVPLIVHGAELAGATPDHPVQLIDVATTIMRLAGAEPHPLDEGRDVWGEPRPAVFSEQAGWAMAVTGRHKVACHAGDASVAEVYDLDADPFEADNLAGTAAGRDVADAVWAEHLAPFLADAPLGYAPNVAPARLSRRMLVTGREP